MGVFESILSAIIFISISFKIHNVYFYLMPMDGLIHSICIYMLYRFAHRYFIFICCYNSCKICVEFKIKTKNNNKHRTVPSASFNPSETENRQSTMHRRSVSAQNIIKKTKEKKKGNIKKEYENEESLDLEERIIKKNSLH